VPVMMMMMMMMIMVAFCVLSSLIADEGTEVSGQNGASIVRIQSFLRSHKM
jgi:hypothetical protein